ncbi:kelch-like protein 10 [Larus michahellis]|uniref:kelch-like protein 10 n=1 Tax=Larus michahellis TaxID=119627 RepID=UPI003D9B7C70
MYLNMNISESFLKGDLLPIVTPLERAAVKHKCFSGTKLPRERKMSAVACPAFHGLCPEGKLGDGIISVDGIEFIAYKMILSSCSPYFRALFSSNWSNAERKVYKIPGTSSEMMRLLMEYAYTGTVRVTDDNVESLLIAADQFNVLDIVRLCCEFLKSQLCLENCVGIWRFTGYYYCPDLREAAHEFILHHFEEVSRVSTEFVALSFNDLERLLEKDELPVKEEAVFEAVLKWVAHDLQNRRQHVVVLLGKEGWKPFDSLKKIPKYPLPFQLTQEPYIYQVSKKEERRQERNSQLGQKRLQAIAYYSTELDLVIQGTNSCARAVAAAALMVEKARKVVLGHLLTLMVHS